MSRRGLREQLRALGNTDPGSEQALVGISSVSSGVDVVVTPVCRICGKPMTVAHADAFATTYACPGGDWRYGPWKPFEDSPDRSLADDHFSASMFKVGTRDQEIESLKVRVRELEQECDHLLKIEHAAIALLPTIREVAAGSQWTGGKQQMARAFALQFELEPEALSDENEES